MILSGSPMTTRRMLVPGED